MRKLYKKARKSIEREFFRFRRTNLIHARKAEIWDICHKIHFYSCVKEYFSLNSGIPKLYLELAVAEPALLQTMWNTYLKHENLQYQTWEEIEEILETVVLQWKVSKAA